MSETRDTLTLDKIAELRNLHKDSVSAPWMRDPFVYEANRALWVVLVPELPALLDLAAEVNRAHEMAVAREATAREEEREAIAHRFETMATSPMTPADAARIIREEYLGG